jgi:hypothetical protein
MPTPDKPNLFKRLRHSPVKLALVLSGALGVVLAVVLLLSLPRGPIHEDISLPADRNSTGGTKVSVEQMQALAPPQLAGLQRVSLKVVTVDTASVKAIALEAHYAQGPRQIGLKIVHSPSLEQVIGFGGPATSEYDRQTASGYQRRQRQGESIVLEQWDRAARSGKFGRIAGQDFYVFAEGEGVSLQDLKHAVDQFPADRLAKLKSSP